MLWVLWFLCVMSCQYRFVVAAALLRFVLLTDLLVFCCLCVAALAILSALALSVFYYLLWLMSYLATDLPSAL